jgi:hypothetical protein
MNPDREDQKEKDFHGHDNVGRVSIIRLESGEEI